MRIPAGFEQCMVPGCRVAGQFAGKLANEGERITVKLPAPFDADIQSFVFEDDWYPETDGAGYSLAVNLRWRPWINGTAGTGGCLPGLRAVLRPLRGSAYTGPSAASGTVGVSFNYQIAAANEPQSYSASGLPAGLTVDPATGLISGIPQSAGDHMATITASSAAGAQSLR